MAEYLNAVNKSSMIASSDNGMMPQKFSLRMRIIFSFLHSRSLLSRSALTADPKKQRVFAFQIWMKWRFLFENSQSLKNVIIEIEDFGLDVILYVYQNSEPRCTK
jgi:hypothetical protein